MARYDIGKVYQFSAVEGGFIHNGINRKTNRKHIAKLADDMRANGFRKEFPLIVAEDGTILNGQHRWEARKQARVSVWAVISDMTAEDARRYNNLSRNQSIVDNLEIMSRMGNVYAQAVLDAYSRYKFSISTVFYIAYGSDTGRHGDSQVKPFDLDKFYERLEIMLRYEEIYPIRAVAGKNALAMLVYQEAIDNDRMLSKLMNHGNKFIGRHGGRIKFYLEELEECYNYSAKKDEKVFFAKQVLNRK